MTLVLLPMAFLLGFLNYSIERRMFNDLELKVRKNFSGFLYVLAYSFLLQPASILGYMDEVLRTENLGNKMNTMKIGYVCVPLLMSLSTASLANGLDENQTSSERAAGTEFFE